MNSNLSLILGCYDIAKVKQINQNKNRKEDRHEKIIAIVLALATVFTFSATAFAAPSGRINKAQAKQIALDHAGFTENEVRFTKAKLDFDDGIFEYDIEFFVGRVEYDYTIAAADGRIIEFDIDGKEPAAPADIITKDEAKAIALGHAGLTESEVRFTKVELDYDDGAYEYEVEFTANNTEYDYTVNAANGKIVDFDREPVEHHFSLSVLVRWIKDFFAAIFG